VKAGGVAREILFEGFDEFDERERVGAEILERFVLDDVAGTLFQDFGQ